jgi:Uma2 family endonuclease
MIGLLRSAQRSYQFDVRQFNRMVAASIFGDEKVELVAGRIYSLTDLPPHTFAIGRFHAALWSALSRDEWTIREEKPILIGRFWAPKPDIAVLRGGDLVYATRHPRARDVAMLVEISDTTYHRDRGRKWRRYAAAGIATYMIVRLKGPDTLVEVWSRPTGRGKAARYIDVVRYSARAGESVPIEIDGNGYGQIAVSELIGPQP